MDEPSAVHRPVGTDPSLSDLRGSLVPVAGDGGRTGTVGSRWTRADKAAAREAARALRAQRRTYDEIALELGVSKSSCSLWLRDVVTPADRERGRLVAAAGTEVEGGQLGLDLRLSAGPRELARELRRGGALLKEVAEALGVTVKTASVWCDGLPSPERARSDPARARARARETHDTVMAEREAARQRVKASAADAVGTATSRDLVLALAVSYWCEGTKDKPWARRERLVWMNSDPGLVTLYLRGLVELGVPQEDLRFRVSLHETADEPAVRAWWARHVGVAPEQFQRTALKRHRPTTTRLNTGDHYRGCLVVNVVRSRQLYQLLDGLVAGLVTSARQTWPKAPEA